MNEPNSRRAPRRISTCLGLPSGSSVRLRSSELRGPGVFEATLTAHGSRRLVHLLHMCQESRTAGNSRLTIRQSHIGSARPVGTADSVGLAALVLAEVTEAGRHRCVLLAASRRRRVLYLIGLELLGASSHEASSGGSGEIAPSRLHRLTETASERVEGLLYEPGSPERTEGNRREIDVRPSGNRRLHARHSHHSRECATPRVAAGEDGRGEPIVRTPSVSRLAGMPETRAVQRSRFSVVSTWEKSHRRPADMIREGHVRWNTTSMKLHQECPRDRKSVV